MVKRILQQKGFTVDTAKDGKESVEKLRRNGYAYGLVITEIIMSYAGGFEVIETVKRESSVPVMVLSAVADENTIQESFRLNADDFLKKPFMAGELVQRVQRLLARSRVPKYAPVERVPAREELKRDEEVIAFNDPVIVPEPIRVVQPETVFVKTPPQYIEEEDDEEEEDYEMIEPMVVRPVIVEEKPVYKEAPVVATITKTRLKRETPIVNRDRDDDGKPQGLVKKGAATKKKAEIVKKPKTIPRKHDYEL